jgi:hypothetical protein
MDDCLFSPSGLSSRPSGVAARPRAQEEASTRKEGPPCNAAAALCSAEARLRHRKDPAGVRRDRPWSRATLPLEAARNRPRSLVANACRKGEQSGTYVPASDAYQPAQMPNSCAQTTRTARGVSRECDDPAGPVHRPSPQMPSIAAQQRKGTPLEEQAPRPGEPQSAAYAGSPRCPVHRDARRLHSGAHPVADAHGRAADGACVRAVRACCGHASETAATAGSEAPVRRAQ